MSMSYLEDIQKLQKKHNIQQQKNKEERLRLELERKELKEERALIELEKAQLAIRERSI